MTSALQRLSSGWPFLRILLRPQIEGYLRTQSPQLKAMAARWGWEDVASDWEAVVQRKDAGVIDICTPNYLHLSPCPDCDLRR